MKEKFYVSAFTFFLVSIGAALISHQVFGYLYGQHFGPMAKYYNFEYSSNLLSEGIISSFISISCVGLSLMAFVAARTTKEEIEEEEEEENCEQQSRQKPRLSAGLFYFQFFYCTM